MLEILRSSAEPLTGSALAERFGVSRQVVVTDIAILRSRYPELIATNRGYLLMRDEAHRRVFKVIHTSEQSGEELRCIVELGGHVMDVYVNHRVYGTIRTPLDIRSKRDVDLFLADLESGVSTPLLNITNGYHYHTVEARSEAILDEIEECLRSLGFLIETLPAPVIYEPKDYSQV